MSQDEPRDLGSPFKFGNQKFDKDFRPKPETSPKGSAVVDAVVEIEQNPPLNPIPPATEQVGKAPETQTETPTEQAVPEGTTGTQQQSDSSSQSEASLTQAFPWDSPLTNDPASSQHPPQSATPAPADSESVPSEKPKPENN